MFQWIQKWLGTADEPVPVVASVTKPDQNLALIRFADGREAVCKGADDGFSYCVFVLFWADTLESLSGRARRAAKRSAAEADAEWRDRVRLEARRRMLERARGESSDA
jgi:hypothetical protein